MSPALHCNSRNLRILLKLLLCWSIWSSSDIADENLLSGDKHWWHPQAPRIPILQGYASQISVYPGETIQFKIRAVQAIEKFNLTIYRLGYYNGDGARFLTTITATGKDVQQPHCMFESASRMVDCANWNVSSEWMVPSEAVTGVYIALPVVAEPTLVHDNYDMVGLYIPFVVKRPKTTPNSDILFKTADMTWVAYNKFGGWNFYRGNGSFGFESRATKASYNRPFFNRRLPFVGQYQNFVFGAEYAMIYWLEQYGYDVSYVACSDLEWMAQHGLLEGHYRAVLSVGHDEYWTQAVKDAHLQAREVGIHLAFFSGNEAFWRVRWAAAEVLYTTTLYAINDDGVVQQYSRTTRPSTTSTSDIDTHAYHQRVLICQKETIENQAPPYQSLWTGTFEDPRHRPADPTFSLTGQFFLVNAYRNESIDVTARDAQLGFWRDTHISAAATTTGRTAATAEDLDKIVHSTTRGVLGYEMDVVVDDCYRPNGLVSLSTTRRHIVAALSEQYGQSYRGSGTVTHKLTMYRYVTPDHRDFQHSFSMIMSRRRYSRIRGSTLMHTTLSARAIKAYCNASAYQSVNHQPTTSALMFGAGSTQYAWALSPRHDGPYTKTDPTLQQATLNLLADMQALPDHRCRDQSLANILNDRARATLKSLTSAAHRNSNNRSRSDTLQLLFPTASTDKTPPRSHVRSLHTLHLSPLRVVNHLAHYRATSADAANTSNTPTLLSASNAPTIDTHDLAAIVITGTAADVAGVVASVELSLNGGKNWRIAVGREQWSYVHLFNSSSADLDHQQLLQRLSEFAAKNPEAKAATTRSSETSRTGRIAGLSVLSSSRVVHLTIAEIKRQRQESQDGRFGHYNCSSIDSTNQYNYYHSYMHASNKSVAPSGSHPTTTALLRHQLIHGGQLFDQHTVTSTRGATMSLVRQQWLVVVSRAVDDNAWSEDVVVQPAICALVDSATAFPATVRATNVVMVKLKPPL